MKTFKKLYKVIILLTIGVTIIVTACKKEEFDPPHFVMPTFTIPAGDTLLTIAQLKAMHTVPNSLDSIKNNYWIKGIINGNDEFGNIYKKLYIQDTTGGMVLSLNAADLFNKYKQGQEIYVKCKNLVYGYYGGVPQLGAVYNNAAGQLAEAAIPNHLFKNGWQGNVPAPVVINGAADLTLGKLFTLVRFDSVSFVEAGQTYASSTATTNRTLTLKDGSTIIVRTSNYATFQATVLPSGKGTVIAILSKYNTDYQLFIRNTNDVFGFTP